MMNVDPQSRACKRRLSRWLLGAGLAGLAATPDATADLKAPATEEGKEPAPLVKAIEATAVRGIPVEIELRALTQSPRSVDFVIRSAPEAGTVSEPRRLPRGDLYDRAAVVYTPAANAGVAADRFTFAARIPGGPTSQSVPVTITLADPVSELVAEPGKLGFGRVMVGESLAAAVQVRNLGTAAFRGRIAADAPWHLASDLGEVIVPPGEAVPIEIVFAPGRPGLLEGEIALEGEGDSALLVPLTGEGFAPFEAGTSHVRARWEESEGARRASLQIRNPGSAEKRIVIEAGEGIEMPEHIEVAGGDVVQVPVAVTNDPPGPFRGRAVLKWQRYEQTIDITAGAVPARVTALAAGSGGPLATLDLGETGPDDPIEAAVLVRNIGGESGTVIIEPERPFDVPESSRSVPLGAGEGREISIRLKSKLPGEHTADVIFYCGLQELRIPVRGIVSMDLKRPEETGAAARGGGSGTAAAAAAVAALTASPGSAARGAAGSGRALSDQARKLETFLAHWGISQKRDYRKDVPQIAKIAMTERQEESMTLAWPIPEDGEGFNYILERPSVYHVPDKGVKVKLWVPHKNVEFSSKDGLVFAKVGGLRPASRYGWRVVTEDPSRGFSMPPRERYFDTLPPRTIPWRIVIGVTAALLLVVVLIYRRRLAAE